MILNKPGDRKILQRGLVCLLITTIVVIGVLLSSDKFTFTLVKETFTGDNLEITYADLNFDHQSERVEFHTYSEGKSGLIVKSQEQILEQWNFDGVFASNWEPMINDYDNDGVREIFVCSMVRDSLYLHCIDAFSGRSEFRDVPVCKLFEVNGNYSVGIELVDFIDIDHDGMKEILFAIMTGFAKKPRRVFAYYPVLDTIMKSPESGAILRYFKKADLDQDSIPEYFGSCQAAGNYDLENKFSDMFSWLMVLEPDLTFKFPPLKTGSYPSMTEFSPFNWKNEKCILALHDHKGLQNEDDYLAVYDGRGKLLHRKEVTDPHLLTGAILIPPAGSMPNPVVINQAGMLFSIGENLEMHKKKQLKDIQVHPPYYFDLDHDGEREILFFKEGRRGFTVFRNSFRDPATIQLEEITGSLHYAMVNDNNYTDALSISMGKKNLIYDYHRTFVFRYWYILAAIVFLAACGIYLLFLKIREFRELKRSWTQDQLAELQMRSIQNQLDPHFTFNILQSFGTLLNETNKEKAQYLFDKYADLLKTSVLNSDKVLVALAEELDFVESYILLERFRQQDRFEHQVEVSKEVNSQLQIPKMLIHIFVENAVKHGLRHREPGGNLSIKATREDGFMKISIKDNGIGREEAAKLARFSTGKGLGILDQILELYTLLHRKKINYYITDLKDGPNAIGTQVDIFIPE